MNIILEIKSPELANAINALAAAMQGGKIFNASNVIESNNPVQNQQMPSAVPTTSPPQQTPVQQQAPVQQPNQSVPTQQYQQPVQQQPQQVVPTSAPTYTMDQLAVAATQLMDAGRQQDLLSLLASFGVQSLMQLPQEQYGAFATKLREAGAKI